MIHTKKKLQPSLLDLFKKNIFKNYRVIIKLKINLDKLLKKLQNNNKCTVIHAIKDLNIICAIITHKILYNLIDSPEISYICLDSEVYLCGNKLPTLIDKHNPKTPIHTSNLTGKNIGVGVIDSGIYPLNIFIKPRNRILFFKDLIKDYKYPYDDNGHGTSICNIIGGSFIYKNSYMKTSNECSLCVIKAFDKYNKSYTSLIFKALYELYENISNFNIQILCLPFEIHEFNDFILDIFQNIIDKFIKYNILIVLPVGNNSSSYNSLKGLSLLKNCLTVGGINYIDSSCGIKNKNLCIPYVVSIYENLYTSSIDTNYIPVRNDKYIYPPKLKSSFIECYGTSMSCAHICSMLALLKQKNNQININDVLSLIKISSTQDENIDPNIQGFGKINLNQLLE